MTNDGAKYCCGWLVVGLATLALLTAAAAHGQDGLDLPIPPPVLGQATQEAPPSPEEDGDDPRDAPPPTLYGEDIDTETDALVYVVDFSCSMSLMEPNPFSAGGSVQQGTRRERAVAELTASIGSLAPNFSFTIVRYGTAFVAWRPRLERATPENKADAISWCAQTQCLGETITGPATVYGLALGGSAHVVLLTDGQPNWDGSGVAPPSWHRALIRDRNVAGAVIDVFGLHPPFEAAAFCQGVASDSGGNYYEVR